MNPTLLILAVALFPVVALLLFVYTRDRYEREPLPLLLAAFGVGLLAVIPAALMELGVERLAPDHPVGAALFDGFCVAALCEELVKLLLLSWLIWRNRNFNEYFDGIVYAVFVSMGFACCENLLYVFGQETFSSSLITGTMRALLSVPAHFLFAVAMGYHLALAKFDAAHRRSHLFKALLYPVLLHGIFDTLLMLSPAFEEQTGIVMLLFVVFILFDIHMWRWGMRRMRRLQELSRQQSEERSRPFSDFRWFAMLLLILLPLTGRGQTAASEKTDEKTRILFIVNCSHSMWDHWQSDAKIKVTQKVLLRFLDSIAGQDDMEVALRVFGHLNRGSYTTHLEVPFSADNRYALQSKIKTLVPNGGNSTATALSRSLDDFPLTDKSRNIIIIITDGIDDADGDICQVARQVQLSGIVVQTFILGIGNPNDFRQSLDCAGTFTYMPEEDGYTEALYDIFRRSEARAPVVVELLDESGSRYETQTPVIFYNRATQVAQYTLFYDSDGIAPSDTLWIDPLVEYDVEVLSHPAIRREGLHFSSAETNMLRIAVGEGTLRLRHGSQRVTWQVPQYDVLVREHGRGELLLRTRMGIATRLRSGRYDIDILSSPRVHLDDVTVAAGQITDLELPQTGLLTLTKPKVITDGVLFVDRNGRLEEVCRLNPNVAVEQHVLMPGRYVVMFKPQHAASDKQQSCRFTIEPAQTTNLNLTVKN